MNTADWREQARELDAADPLAPMREEFLITDPDRVYLDGNSLGRPSRAALAALRRAAEQEWGEGLITSWEQWVDLPRVVGERIAGGLLGAAAAQTVVADSTTVCLYKALRAALTQQRGRRVLVGERHGFPTDSYLLQALARDHDVTVRWVEGDLDAGVSAAALAAVLDEDVAAVLLSHVDYRSGGRADLAAQTAQVHGCGALAVWDVSHSVGAMPVELDAAGVDFAAGCTYKYLGGGPGSPAFLYVRTDLLAQTAPTIAGWFAQREMFAMNHRFDPQPDARRLLSGTPPVLALRCLEAALDVVCRAGPAACDAKGRQLTSRMIAIVDDLNDRVGAAAQLRLASPLRAEQRGCHVTFHHPQAAALTAAWRRRGVIVDFREPNRVRLGLAPLTTRFVDLVTAGERLAASLGELSER